MRGDRLPTRVLWCVYAIQRVSQAPRRSRYMLALSACRRTDQACASNCIWRIETPRPAQNQHSVKMRLPMTGSIIC